MERGADLHMAQRMPLPLTVSCFSKIQIGFSFLVPAYLGSPEQRAVKRLCVCVFWHHLAETMEQCPPIVLCAVALWSLAYIPYFVNIRAIQAL